MENKKTEEENEQINNVNSEKEEEIKKTDENSETAEKAKPEEESEEEKLKKELDETKDRYLRLMAEYDNFRKRSAKEKAEIYSDAAANTISQILPVYDNFERALASETSEESYRQGVEMIFKQFSDMLAKLGVEILNPLGEEFNPDIANAVTQVSDESLGENVVAQVLQKGYKLGDKVIRYAMVSVANP